MKQLEVTIMGQTYILACPEGRETDLLEAVGSVDREMSNIRDAGKVKARERIAVLAALNLAYALAERSSSAAASSEAMAVSANPSDRTGSSGVDLDALLRRVDAALGGDGQLL
ncbi:MAG TPA: cell division protein ZapA [Burkholderiaceae bacterium]|nr:cell division protein ZapA [Burkholderiaceae bacterium]HMX09728.1 cell division protein ZapA [Burkholderiaceae bacterium]HMZ00143.1 cell division protein ZapA [Burkholderiaceae bacterium]HNB43899.1 cell division protein ZapA [Burkholderiaceae bacterium]HNG81770.1 cell division protein ZapA [Burkholderiaceae bacterium]